MWEAAQYKDCMHITKLTYHPFILYPSDPFIKVIIKMIPLRLISCIKAEAVTFTLITLI